MGQSEAMQVSFETKDVQTDYACLTSPHSPSTQEGTIEVNAFSEAELDALKAAMESAFENTFARNIVPGRQGDFDDAA